MEYEYLTNEKEGMIYLLIGNEAILRQSGATKKQ